jgi:hypothetical protein
MVVLIEAEPGAGAIDPAVASDLARLGVTSIAVLHDDASVAVVLDGWAFDPVRAGEQAAALVAGDRGRVRTLRPLLQASVSTEQPAPASSLARARSPEARNGISGQEAI